MLWRCAPTCPRIPKLGGLVQRRRCVAFSKQFLACLGLGAHQKQSVPGGLEDSGPPGDNPGKPPGDPYWITPGDPLRGVPPGPPGGSPRRSPREPPRGLPRGLPAITCNFSILYKETDPETILDRSSSSSCVDLMCCSSKMDGRKLSYDFLLVGLWPPTLDMLWRCAPTCPHACW